MFNSRHKKDRLQRVLKTAHASKVDLPTADGWQSVVMARIRAIKTVNEKPQITFLLQFEALVWRLAPFAAVLLVVICIALHEVKLISGGDLLRLIAYENDGLDFWWL